MADQPAKDVVRVTLPTAALVMWMAFAVLLAGGLWAALIALGVFPKGDFYTGFAGIAVTAFMSFAGVLILSPWKRRAIVDWMTMWLATTVFRVLVTPVAAYLLYSAASSHLSAKPFGLAVALTYIATLFVEAAVLAQYMKAVSDQRSAIGNDHPSD